MKTYLVIRPYCNPRRVVVIEESAHKAKKAVAKEFGSCMDAKAIVQKKKGIVAFVHVS